MLHIGDQVMRIGYPLTQLNRITRRPLRTAFHEWISIWRDVRHERSFYEALVFNIFVRGLGA